MTAPRTLVLGAGVVGAAAVWDLVRRGHDVTVADADGAAAATVAEAHGAVSSPLDVRDDSALVRFVDGFDAMVSAVPYSYGVRLARTAIRSGSHYVDFGGNPTVVRQQLELDDAASAADVAVVPDCGLAPGVANVLAEDLIRRLGPGAVDSLQIRVGALPVEPVGTLKYQLAFSPGGLINEYDEPCEVLIGGRRTEVDPLTRFESVDWEGIGTLEAFSTAGGTSAMCRDHEGRVLALEYKTLRYPGHGYVFRAMRELGLFDEVPGEAGGNATPRQVLLDVLARHLPRGAPDVVLVRAWAVRGEERTQVEIEDRHDGRFSALARTTAFPATALVDLLVRGTVATRGVRTMHQAVSGEHLVPELHAVGITPAWS